MSKAILVDNESGRYYLLSDSWTGGKVVTMSDDTATIFDTEELAVMAIIENDIARKGKTVSVLALEDLMSMD